MRKLFPLVVLLLCTCVTPAQTQLTSSQARDAEWKTYALPQTNFVRQIDPDKQFIFRIPVDWKQEGTELRFTGPNSARIRVAAQKIPDGYPLRDYFTSLVRGVQEQPGSAEAMVTRKTQLQDLEARELFFEMPNPEGDTIRSVSWVAVNGPLALTFNLQVPVAHAAEIEPLFKAVLQSIIFLPREHQSFEELRASTLKTTPPGAIHELEDIVASLNEIVVDRDAAVTRLSTLFTTSPELAVDLLVDRRPLVRAAAVQALARSNNTSLQPFVWEMIDDREPLVAEAAARSVSGLADLVPQILKHSSSGHRIETIARIWPFMTKEKRKELLERFFSKTAVPRPTPSASAKKTDVLVTTAEMAPVKPGSPVPDVTVGVSNDPNVQVGALTLISTIPVEEFKLPLTQIVASNYDPLIALSLQVANYRRESLPLDQLFKLVSSSDQQVSKFAAQNLAFSARASDISRIEALISKDGKKPLDDELKLTIKKIQFRTELAKSPNESRQIVNKASSDPALATFAWGYDCEATIAGCEPAATLKPDFAVKSLGENLFPKKVRHFTAIPNAGQTVQKFYESLNGIQMNSPRAQAHLALIINAVRLMLARQLSAPAEAETIAEYTGIDLNAPIVLGSWTADKALDSINLAERQAIVLRVKDRARFERVVDQFQQASGSFANLTDYVAIGTRAIAALPAFLPLTAQGVLARDPLKPRHEPIQTYTLASDREWHGLRVKTIEQRWITHDWHIENSVTHLVYLGDRVIITSELATVRDLIAHANNPAEHPTLSDNTQFRKAIERRGEIVYFSDFKAVMAEAGAPNKDFNYDISESGALNIGNSLWENTHHLDFNESDWSRHLLPFEPKSLTAPRELLPASTIAYYLMNIDLVRAWKGEFGTFLPESLQSSSKLWGIDFEKEVLPELGPECGASIIELPEIKDFGTGGTWATFCKLKSNKLSEVFNNGKLFNGVGPAKDMVEVKNGADSYFFTIRSGFLVFSNREKGLQAFDGKSSLATTRDYSKAVEKVPGSIVAFGGYNLEAAVATASNAPREGLEGQIAGTLFSIASAFHSQNFFATATRGSVEGRSSVAMDREGRYSSADFSSLTKESSLTLASVEPRGTPITNQRRLSSLSLRVKAKTDGPIDNIKDDIKTSDQVVEQKSPRELILTVSARRAGTEKSVQLPVSDPQFAAELKSTAEFPANDEHVKEQAKQIAGVDRDAWSVARKLADWTNQNLEWKSVANADAAQTLASREADCSEFSALFVAMARSLGLPARIVSGLAYSGSSFGGHAWVEVWAGRWIELDPTWGTHFVDATHIRDASSALVTSAALNLLEVEVVEARRPVEDFQKTSRALAQQLVKTLVSGYRSEVEAVVDVAILTDEFMGAGAWAKMSEAERDQMSSAYRRVLSQIVTYSNNGLGKTRLRLIHTEEKGNVAEAIYWLGPSGLFLKLRMVRNNDVWSLVEFLEVDTNLNVVAEIIRPTIASIESARAGKRLAVGMSDVSRILMLYQNELEKALAVADQALKAKPTDRGLRLMKANVLLELEKNDEGIKLLRELSDENFAPAVYRLADHMLLYGNKFEAKDVLPLYEHYVQLEPYDPRVLHDLAASYEVVKDVVKAEAAYRRFIEINPTDVNGYVELAVFLVEQKRFTEVEPVLETADKNKDDKSDVFSEVLLDLQMNQKSDLAISFAAADPRRLKTSAEANLTMAKLHIDAGRYPVALRFLQTAINLDKEWDEPYITMAYLYRKQSRWIAALRAADKAIELDDEDGEAQYERACALARLGRVKEAMSALEKAIELYPGQAEWMSAEPDLSRLINLPAFKKLAPQPEKQ